MKVLNLYSGIGGNRKFWHDCDVTSIEIDEKIANVYSKFYPNDKVIIGDAHQYLHEHYFEYDFIWSSPPCQSHSRMVKGTRHNVTKYPDMKLYQEIILLQQFFEGMWVVENVIPYYESLIKPTTILQRHCFWSNFKISDYKLKTIDNFINGGTVKDSEKLKEWLGLNYDGNLYYENNHCPCQILRNCVHPDLGLHIFNQSMNVDKKVFEDFFENT